MKYFIISILVLCITVVFLRPVQGQSAEVVTEAQFEGGINKLLLTFYKIDFTKQQLKLLQHKEIELIFLVGANGKPTLEKISGLQDPDLLDSLQNASTRLPYFKPRTRNGVAEEALLFVKFQYPTYQTLGQPLYSPEALRYNEAAYEDFEYIHISGQRLDMLVGGVANVFLGSPGRYLAPGGGMKLDILYLGQSGFGGGLLMNFYGNKLKQDFPVASDRAQNSAPPTAMVGLALTKLMLEKERKELMLQLELNMVVQNITPRTGEYDQDWTQLKGFSPGLVAHYLVQFGKNKTYYYYGAPSIYSHYLNLHAAVRPLFMDLKQASGVMLEVGVGYRMGVHAVDEYRLK